MIRRIDSMSTLPAPTNWPSSNRVIVSQIAVKFFPSSFRWAAQGADGSDQGKVGGGLAFWPR